jgi:Na+/H+ antiporter NhaD/arsenite permease-like protein
MSKLSKKELAAIDLMIAQLEEKGSDNELGSFISSIVNAVSAVANAATNVAVNAAQAASSAVTAACPAVVAVCPALAAAGKTTDSSSANYATLMDNVKKSGLPDELTLESLKKIRKENS